MKARWTYTIAHRSTMSYEQEMRYGLQPIQFPIDRYTKNIINSDSLKKYYSSCFAFRDLEVLYQTSKMYFTTDTFPVYKQITESINTSTTEALSYYEPVEINNLGWINCDRFYNVPTCDSTTFVFENNIKINSYKIYYKFKNRNSVMAENIFMPLSNNLNFFLKLPINETIEIIVFAASNNIIYTSNQVVTLQRKNKIIMQLKESNVKVVT